MPTSSYHGRSIQPNRPSFQIQLSRSNHPSSLDHHREERIAHFWRSYCRARWAFNSSHAQFLSRPICPCRRPPTQRSREILGPCLWERKQELSPSSIWETQPQYQILQGGVWHGEAHALPNFGCQSTDPCVKVLFYDDPEAVNGMPPMLGNLIKEFPEWSEHSNGIAQYVSKRAHRLRCILSVDIDSLHHSLDSVLRRRPRLQLAALPKRSHWTRQRWVGSSVSVGFESSARLWCSRWSASWRSGQALRTYRAKGEGFWCRVDRPCWEV